MTDKDRRVSMLNEDMQAGRVRLPEREQGAWMREYLGEWEKPPITGAYAISKFASVKQSCALCSEPVDISHCTPDTYPATMAAHHAVCPKRPIAVGDYVRWDGQMDDGSNCKRWAEGEVVGFKLDKTQVRIARSSDKWFAAEPYFTGPVLRRISRPAAAQATVLMVSTCDVCCIPGATAETGRCNHGYLYRSVVREPAPPAPALVDGLTREQCLERWMENRLAVEGGARPPNKMNRMQRDVGRTMWLAGPGAKRSAELRDLVAADREAERNRVRVEVQDVG